MRLITAKAIKALEKAGTSEALIRKAAGQLYGLYGDDVIDVALKYGDEAVDAYVKYGDDAARVLKSGLTQEKINEILSMPKGNRPNPTTYLSKEYIDEHLAQFINISNPANYKISIPSGNEVGANLQWVPGGIYIRRSIRSDSV